MELAFRSPFKWKGSKLSRLNRSCCRPPDGTRAHGSQSGLKNTFCRERAINTRPRSWLPWYYASEMLNHTHVSLKHSRLPHLKEPTSPLAHGALTCSANGGTRLQRPRCCLLSGRKRRLLPLRGKRKKNNT